MGLNRVSRKRPAKQPGDDKAFCMTGTPKTEESLRLPRSALLAGRPYFFSDSIVWSIIICIMPSIMAMRFSIIW